MIFSLKKLKVGKTVHGGKNNIIVNLHCNKKFLHFS